MRLSYLYYSGLELPEDAGSKQTENGNPVLAPLKKLPPGRWRSLGGYLNYANWSERQRFLELDAAIEALQSSQPRPAERLRNNPHRSCRMKLLTGEMCRELFWASEEYVGWYCEKHRHPDLPVAAGAPVITMLQSN